MADISINREARDGTGARGVAGGAPAGAEGGGGELGGNEGKGAKVCMNYSGKTRGGSIFFPLRARTRTQRDGTGL